MSRSEVVSEKSYVIDSGVNQGITEDTIFEVYRILPAIHTLSGASGNLIQVLLGEMQVLSVGDFSSVVLQVKVNDAHKILEYPYPMIGDTLIEKK